MNKLVIAGLALMFTAATAVAQGGGGGSSGGGSSGGGSSGGGSSSGGSSSGGSNSGSSSNNNNGGMVKKCKSGQVWKKSAKKCVSAELHILPDDELYAQGSALAKDGQYDWAIAVLSTISRKDDPHVLNYLGYSHRKAGRLDIGLGYYQKALAIDPNFVLAREYLGEGYVAAGKLDLARDQLREIGNRCGTNCEEYIELAEVISGAH
jgi:tetratricopeptide (TPR) repeat protein